MMPGLDPQTVDEMERQGLMAPEVAAAYRERANPTLPAGVPEPPPQQVSSGPMPGLAPPESAAKAAWGSTAQAVLGRKLQPPDVDTSGYNQAPDPGEVGAAGGAAPVQGQGGAAMPRITSSAGAMAANRREYGGNIAANVREQRAAGKRELAGRMEAEEVGAQRAMEESGYAKERIAQMEADQAAAVERKRRFDEAMKQKQASLDAEMAAAREERIEDRRSIGQRIGGAIAIGLGTYAQILGGGENTALKLVQQQIDADITSQREGMAARRQLLRDKRQMLGEERQQFTDDEDFANKRAAQGYEIAKSKIDALLNEKYLDPQKRAHLEALRGQFEAEQAKNVGAIMERAAVNTNSMLANEDAARARVQGMQLEMMKAASKEKGKPPGEGALQKIADLRATRRELQQIRDEYVEKTGAGAFITKHLPGSEAQKMDRKLANAKIRFRRAMTGVQFNPMEAEEYNKLFPSASTIDETAINNLDAIIESTENQERIYLETQRQSGHDMGQLEEGGPDAGAASGFVPE
jgi:hypothetical protein